jgi:hypothetical protein
LAAVTLLENLREELMPTDLPSSIAFRSQADETTTSFQALFLFYCGMALTALLFLAGDQCFGVFPGLTTVQAEQMMSPEGFLIGESVAIPVPAGP